MTASVVSVPIAAVVLSAGCHHGRPAGVMDGRCAPVATPLEPTVNVAELPGTYRVSFVVTRGATAGAAPVEARLVLRDQDSALVRLGPPEVAPGADVTQPVIGQLDLLPSRLGAADTGDPMSADSTRPGVAAYVTRRPDGGVTSLTMRVGSVSNARGPLRFDGSYFALYVRRVGTDGFAGGWASGVGLQSVEGYFCAARLTR